MDPFTALTGGAGLASLGITICNGLLTYCSNFRSRGDDLIILDQRTKELKSFLHLLNQRVDKITDDDVDTKASLQECYDRCTLCLVEIDKFQKKYTAKPQGSDLKSYAGSIPRKFQYPFQKDRFESLRRQIHEFHVAISSQIVLLNTHVFNITNDLRRLTLSESKNIRDEVHQQEVRLTSQVVRIVPSLEQAMDHGFEKIEQSLESRLENLEQLIKCSLQENSGKTLEVENEAQLSGSQAGVSTNLFQHSRDSWSGRFDNEETSLLQERTGSPLKLTSSLSNALIDLSCHCPTANSHAAGCVLSFRPRRKTIFTGKLICFSLLFRLKVELQYSPLAFPRDFQIQPTLHLRIRNVKSPVWKLIYSSLLSVESSGRTIETLTRALTLIRQYFFQGIAHPTDVDDDGRTVFHIACSAIGLFEKEKNAAIFVEFLKAIVQMGVPVNEVSDHGGTALNEAIDTLVFDLDHSPVTSIYGIGLKRLGAEFVGSGSTPCSSIGGIPCLSKQIRSSIGIETPIEYGELSRAVLEESELDVHRLLSYSKMKLSEKAPSGETPLHLAVCWPRGVEILLQNLEKNNAVSIINAKECNGNTPLVYALSLRQIASVRLLVDAGAYIDLENTRNIEATPWNFYGKQSDEIMEFLSHTLADRRRQLLSIALRWLPPSDVRSLALNQEQMIQENALEVHEALRAHQAPMPPDWHYFRSASIYHSQHMSYELANFLFEAGFSETNTIFHGFSPLMVIDLESTRERRPIEGLFSMVDWFVSHGEDIYKPMPLMQQSRGLPKTPENPAYTIIQRLAFFSGDYYRWLPSRTRDRDGELGERILDMLQTPGSDLRDPCECFCASHGCSLGSLFVRGIFGKTFNSARLSGKLVLISWICSEMSSREIATKFAIDALRTITFIALGLRHTCCNHKDYPEFYHDTELDQAMINGTFRPFSIPDPEEVREIQEEDRFLAERLEELLIEFEEKFTELNQPFGEFLTGYYYTRMMEVLSEETSMSEEDRRGIEEIGVVLE